MSTTQTKTTDLRGLWQQARQGQRFSGRRSSEWFRKPYVPAGEAVMHLARAVQVEHKQSSYSDDSVYEIPYSGLLSSQEACEKRLNDFFWAASNHDGFAGGGCTWSLSHIDRERCVIVAHCRASICD
jgi:hypothetical protein